MKHGVIWITNHGALPKDHGIPVMDQKLQTIGFGHIRTMEQGHGMEWIWNMVLLCILLCNFYCNNYYYCVEIKKCVRGVRRIIGMHIILLYIRVKTQYPKL